MARFRLRDPFFNYRYRHYLHTLRATLALAVTFAIVLSCDIPHSTWAPVSTLMVMGNLPHVGGVIDKGSQRLLGTLLGGLWGIMILLIPAPPPGAVLTLTLAGIAIALHTTFTGRFGYSALMFGITLLMVIGNGNHDLSVALWRAFNVLIGTLVGIIATMTILPQKATDLFRFLLADNLDKLARLYHAHTSAPRLEASDQGELMKTVTSQLVQQRNLIDAVHREGRLRRGELGSLISLERRMISTVELLLETHWATRDGHDIIESLTGLRDAQHRLAHDLGTLAYQVRTGQSIEINIAQFDLDTHAEAAFNARSQQGRALFSPGGYLWLNRELARQTSALVGYLSNLQRLPSQRLRKRARRHHLVSDTHRLAVKGDPHARSTSSETHSD
ncbi:FUSC family protein [Kushneria phosphatilytica]|uniref:FUSC family protein n=1 Tax=Kushneria phosphatilytica TaxID=657387 RepID=A0A1S1NXU7_9GAMM|nr:FUSC family protein [Kushneria phosphatilytica]OHV12196.1 FUSC family protein [Kushneria phosphatilytica]QEL11388.1 FUSC family protein [Kushneria phosphatilytica]